MVDMYSCLRLNLRWIVFDSTYLFICIYLHGHILVYINNIYVVLSFIGRCYWSDNWLATKVQLKIIIYCNRICQMVWHQVFSQTFYGVLNILWIEENLHGKEEDISPFGTLWFWNWYVLKIVYMWDL